MPTPCITYGRHSPRPEEADDQCPSIETQTGRMLEYCRFAKLEPVRDTIPDPLVSARKTALAERPGGKLLLSALGYTISKCKCCHEPVIISPKKPLVPVLVAYSVDRMFRDLTDGMGWLERWTEDGISFHTAGGVIVDASTADGWLCAAIQVLMASYEPRKCSERTSHGMKSRQSRNERMSAQPPYGKMPDPDDDARWIDCPAEIQAIERVKHLAQLSEYQRAGGRPKFTKIAQQLDREGHPSRNGHWHHSAIQRILGR